MSNKEVEGQKVTEDKFNLYVEIIKQCRELDSFTTKAISLMIGVSVRQSALYAGTLRKIGSIEKIGERKSGKGSDNIHVYCVSDNAITLLRRHYDEINTQNMPISVTKPKTKPTVKAKPVTDKYRKCRMVTVKKANVTGMGFGWVNSIDALLREVRV